MIRTFRVIALAGLSFFLLLGPLAGIPSSLLSLTALIGQSGKLRAVFTLPDEEPPGGTDAEAKRPGVYRLFRPGIEPLRIHLIVMKPFSAKVHGRIGSYTLGHWPYEGRAPADPTYASPRGFIEVTPENFDTQVSEHFRLGQFLTKGQDEVWPKYLVLERRLLEKLELTIEELARRGHSVRGLVVMSGFRTPEYNGLGVRHAGRSAVSRHLYGDAADVYPDDKGRGRMDDLNHDGRVNVWDARIVAAAAEAVELEHPELAGGVAVYPGTRSHGPFVHIDARGCRARWGG